MKCLGDGLYVKNGTRGIVYYERPIVAGRRTFRKLKSLTEKDAAKEMARRRELQVQSGFGKAVDPYVKSESEKRPKRSTLGAIFEIYRAKCTLPSGTVEGNVGALCAIVRSAKPEHKEKSKDQIGELPSNLLTAALVRDFQRALQIAAGNDRIKQDTAAVTANSYRRQARGIFSASMIQFYRDIAPATLVEFLSVKALKEPPKQFKMPEPGLLARIRGAVSELKENDQNAYRIYLLAACCGLRKGEITAALWSWITPYGDRYQIHVQTTEDFRPKGRRDRILPMETGVCDELRSMQDEGHERILTGHLTERRETSFRRFSAWMKSLGWNRKKKVHELRKIFGSLVNERYGIHAAQVLLGHSSPSVTDQYYAAPGTIPDLKIFGVAS